jgi:Domain of unknown function (DUF4345)
MLMLLKIFSVTIVFISVLKVVLGAKADQLLDPTISTAAISHPSVDSQVRFYGGAFAIYGVLLWICSNDMVRYADVFRALMICFFAAGAARIPSWIIRGRPSWPIVGLFTIELAAPPLLLWWQTTL